MKRILLVILTVILLSGCTTRVSTELLPGHFYCEDPIVKVIEYDDKRELQQDCYSLLGKKPFALRGCSWVPYDPLGTCIVLVMRGDKETLEHEMSHCHGYADTYF